MARGKRKSEVSCFLTRKQRDFIIERCKKQEPKKKERKSGKERLFEKSMNHRIKKAFLEKVPKFADDFQLFISWCLQRRDLSPIEQNEWSKEAYRLANYYAKWGTRKPEINRKTRAVITKAGLNKTPTGQDIEIVDKFLEVKHSRKYLKLAFKCPNCGKDLISEFGKGGIITTYGSRED